ncbi:MAG: P-loop NTPase [Candidatus Manganitrophus sp.]|nr:MAG: P-loop NTPase [Candidatus Manganitrophus sp.]
MDQAKTLRKWAEGSSGAPRQPRVIAVTSGKGGVGKTNVVANLAVAFSQLGQRVLILDADLALGNVDVLFGIVPPYTLEHVLLGEKSISEIMVQGPAGIRILPTSSGTGRKCRS